jgi:glycosyltransferase involved in cell wall biosynthesis
MMRNGSYCRQAKTGNTKPMRVLHAISSRFLTGPGMSVLALAAAQRKAGTIVTFACEGAGPLAAAAKAAGLEVIDIGLDRKGRPRSVALAAAALAAAEIDVVHVHRSSEHAAAALARNAARKPFCLVRSFYTSLTARPGLWRQATLWLLARRTAAFTAVDERTCGVLRLCMPAMAGRIWRVPGGVDIERFGPGEKRDGSQKTGACDSTPVFGLVAKLDAKARKIDQAIAAWALLERRSTRPFRAVIAGDEGLIAPIEGMVRAAGLQGIVTVAHTLAPFGGNAGFEAAVGGEKSAPAAAGEFFIDLLRSIDVGVQLRPGADSSCRATLEMMSLGRPSVVYKRGALGELVEHGRTGFVCADGDVAGLAAWMAKLLEDDRLRRAMGAAARERAVREFSLARQVERMNEVYEKAME